MPTAPETEKLFVYGIFLNEYNRDRYGMTNPQYATVKKFVTIGSTIVEALYVDEFEDASLTGLLVDMDSSRWGPLDNLEGGYERVKITTTDGTRAYMYARYGTAEQLNSENYSTYQRTMTTR